MRILTIARIILFCPLTFLAKRRVKKITGTENIPKNGPVLLAINHIDFLDGWLTGLLLVPLLKRDIFYITKSKNYFWAGGITIPLDKYGKEESLNKALNVLMKGNIIAHFPEGERNPSNILMRGKTGAVRLALRSKCAIVPIGIIGTYSPTFWRSVWDAIIHSKKVEINIGRPVDLAEYSGKTSDYDLLENCTAKIMKEIAVLSGKSYPY